MRFVSDRSLRSLSLAVMLALAGAGVLRAQEEGSSSDATPESLIKAVKEAVDAKKYGAALKDAQQLQSALAKLRVEQLKALMPGAPADWTAEPATDEPQTAMFAGLGVTVKREYRKGDAEVNATLLSDSPMVAGVAAMMTNPMLLQGNANMSTVTIQGRKCVLEHDKESKSIKLSVLLNGNTALLTFEGNGVERKDVTETLCKAFDFAAIEKALQN